MSTHGIASPSKNNTPLSKQTEDWCVIKNVVPSMAPSVLLASPHTSVNYALRSRSLKVISSFRAVSDPSVSKACHCWISRCLCILASILSNAAFDSMLLLLSVGMSINRLILPAQELRYRLPFDPLLPSFVSGG